MDEISDFAKKHLLVVQYAVTDYTIHTKMRGEDYQKFVKTQLTIRIAEQLIARKNGIDMERFHDLHTMCDEYVGRVIVCRESDFNKLVEDAVQARLEADYG